MIVINKIGSIHIQVYLFITFVTMNNVISYGRAFLMDRVKETVLEITNLP